MFKNMDSTVAPRLSYFGMTGLGEPVRLMLAGTKTQFEDRRISKEEWVKLKPTLKWRQLPMLEIEGKTLFQSMSICRHLARKAGLSGSTEDEAVACDMTVDALEDMRRSVVVPYYKPDSEERDEALKNASKVTVPFYLKNFEEQLNENNEYLVGGKLTWADILFLSHSDYLSFMLNEDILTGFLKLKQHQNILSQLPGIKEYLTNRPPSPKDLRTVFL